MKLNLNSTEIEWLARNMPKMKEMANNMPHLLSTSTQRETFKKLSEKLGNYWDFSKGEAAAALPSEGVEIEITNQNAKDLALHLEGIVSGLELTVKGYEKRMNGPKAVEKYNSYHKKAKVTKDTLKNLLDKVS